MKCYAVTGGLGFIGQQVVQQLLGRGDRVWLVDAETYAANLDLLHHWEWWLANGYLRYEKADIRTLTHLRDVEAVINLAAETHVDNSIRDSQCFVETNVLGVQHLLELIRAKRAYEMPLLLHVSTDEVMGDIPTGSVTESAPLYPSSPYAASKAAAEHLVRAWGRTYGVPWKIIRPSNCYGLGQYPEKLIPKAIRYLTQGKPVPLHAGGHAIRSWLWVEDCARAILTVLDHGALAGTYNVGGQEQSVQAVVARIAKLLDVTDYADLRFQRDGLDRRYAVDDTQLRLLGWVPQGDLWRDLPGLVEREKATFRW